MHTEKACLVINPRDGQNLAKITAILAVLAAAGWKTDVVLKEYGGHTMELATEAARQGYDRVIAYGGDGTLSQVINGVISGKNGKKRSSVVGFLPGGTVNQWAAEVSIPSDSVKAALALISGDERRVDVGRVDVTKLTFLEPKQENGSTNRASDSTGQENGSTKRDDDQQSSMPGVGGKIARVKKIKPATKAKHHFLQMAGLGIDAAIMSQVDKTLKHRIGVVSVGVAAVKKVPEQRPFPIEIKITENKNGTERAWQGEALQVVLGNTRRYGGVVEMTYEASIDDGKLDVCVITAGEPLSTLQQISSLLLRRKPDNQNTQFFRGPHFTIRVPATIDLQLDGTTVKLKDYLSKSDREALKRVEDQERVLVTYSFDILPQALDVDVPSNYHGPLFEDSQTEQATQPSETQHEDEGATADEHQTNAPYSRENQTGELPADLLEHGRRVNVLGVAARSEKKCAFILAGSTSRSSTGEIKPVAVTIDEHTVLLKRTGEPAAAADVQQLAEGAEIIVEGRKSKRGVIRATRAVV